MTNDKVIIAGGVLVDSHWVLPFIKLEYPLSFLKHGVRCDH